MKNNNIRSKFIYCIPITLVLVGLCLISLCNFLLFHSLIEIFSIVVAFGIFIVAWNSRRFLANNYLLFLGIAYLFVGGLDLIHTLAYKGMGVFQGYSTGLATQLWIVSRYLESLSLLIAIFSLSRKLKSKFVFIGYTVVTTFLLMFIFYWKIFPECFVEGAGLTLFKKVSEYIISLILIGSMVLLLKKRREFDRGVLRLLVASIAITIASELAFTFYVDVYGLFNIIGHSFKFLSFYLIYKAIVETGFIKPYDLLFRNLKQSETMLQKAKDGLEVRVEERTTELANANKQLQAEITERKKVEETLRVSRDELRKQNEFLNSVLESLSHPFYVIDANDYTIKMANSAAHPEKLPENTTCYMISHRRDKPCDGVDDPCLLKEVKRTKKPVTVEHIHYDKDGNPRNVEVHGYPILDRDGNVSQMIEYCLDITERKKAEEALRRTAQEWGTTFDSITDLVSIHDKDFKIVRANKSLTDTFNMKPKEIIGKNCYELMHGTKEPPSFCPHKQALETGKPHCTEVFEPHLGIYIQISVSPIFNENGRTIATTHIVKDITERKKAEEEKTTLKAQLHQTQKMEAIGTLAGGIAHDFNNILTAMVGYADLALEDAREGTVAQNYLQQVLIAGSRAKELVRQILTFSRKTEQEQKPMEIAPIVKEALKMLRSSIPTTIEIRQNIQADSSVIMANPTEIHQILVNLCANAAHAMGENGGLLEVSLTDVVIEPAIVTDFGTLQEGSYLKLSVKDTGCGMNREVMGRIFEPFFTTKDVDKGTGMGLSLVHGIVESYGGLITVDSEPGKGTTFNVFFPRIESSITQLSEPSEIVFGQGEMILLVDDEKPIVDMMTQMLQRLGYTVVGKADSIDALKTFRAEPDKFDLVITDYAMPNITGKQLTKELISIRPDIPIILCTGFNNDIDAEVAKSIGIKEFIMKPIDRKNIAAIIRNILDKKEIRV